MPYNNPSHWVHSNLVELFCLEILVWKCNILVSSSCITIYMSLSFRHSYFKVSLINMTNHCKFCPLFTLPTNGAQIGLLIDALVEVTNLLKINYCSSMYFLCSLEITLLYTVHMSYLLWVLWYHIKWRLWFWCSDGWWHLYV